VDRVVAADGVDAAIAGGADAGTSTRR